jgi:outer membrane protein TolC
MNLLLGRNAGELFTVEDSIKLANTTDLSMLKSAMEQNNTTILINRSNIEMAQLNLSDVRGKIFPELGVTAGYSFNNQTSESGFLRSGRSDGLNYGLTASMPILDRFNNRRERQNAKVGIESANLQYETYLAEANAALLSSYSVYSNKLKNIELERENLQTANTNFDIANERYRLGELSGIEIREAQQNLLIAHDRYITLIYQARLLEIEMLRLTGGIIPEK